MIVMVVGSTRCEVHYIAGKYPGRVGQMCSPASGGWLNPRYYMPYAIDNGAFIKFDEEKYFEMLAYAKKHLHDPLFTVVPDVVGDHTNTIEKWSVYYDKVKYYGFKMAFAGQEGCTIATIPKEADCIFIGGKSTKWKLQFAHTISKNRDGRWVHLGRVTTRYRVLLAEKLAMDSTDGNWFRGGVTSKQYKDFMQYFEGPLFTKLNPKQPFFFEEEWLNKRIAIER